ncbi:hypothetical protein, partial [Staphylococcus aureus]|uniref:hypothetical protein n=1 Tax=Staphylococcus aureus TaxID=1280 RepID=UPI0019168665
SKELHQLSDCAIPGPVEIGQHRNDCVGRFVAAALLEVDHFYPYLLKTGRVASIRIRRDGSALVARDRNPYPQIAYGVRPMV